FDDRVQVTAPATAPNPVATPVLVRAPELSGVQEIVVFADLNPITKILEYYPVHAEPTIAFRFKIQQATPVRAAMRTADGVWHVGGQWISAQGGGCTTPSLASGSPLWLSRLGDVSGGIWSRPDDRQRLRFRIIHPMDTGLAAGIPAFYITELTMRSADGDVLARLKPFEPVSENPVISVNLDHRGPVQISGRDSNGNLISATVAGHSG
ncbi:MAG: quinoprotein dehydrogenase-associated SoxYZ-like carrier, partial [Salinisphaera sp.]|nr:quinoprotein dehydrogenase-associated SoxYZ-like carrier [Salinisphaera sp.]